MGVGHSVSPMPDDKSKVTQEELDSLQRPSPGTDLTGIRSALERRSKRFKYCWLTLMGITLSYLIAYFVGLIDPFMPAAATGLVVDNQLHQVRFLLAFVMVTVGTTALSFDWRVEEIFVISAWVQAYFVVTAMVRQWRTGADEALLPTIAMLSILLTIFSLLITLIIEERKRKTGL